MAVRRAAVAGTWYPGEPRALADELEQHLEAAAAPAVPGRLVALISPHAGLRYSGPVAAHGYKLLRGRTGLTFLLVGPSHRTAFHGVSLVASGFFETPFGRLPIDEALSARVAGSHPLIADEPGPHRNEHSLE